MATNSVTRPARRLRVLAIAEAANPNWVSVPLIGWSLSQALRDVADVHMVTQVRNRADILDWGLREEADFTAIDSEAIAGPVWKIAEKLRMGSGKGWTTLQAFNAVIYPHFERLVWARFGDRIRSGKFDIVHRITPLSPTIASPVARRCAGAGCPFVLGPLNGGVPWPAQFDAERRQEKEWLSYARAAYKLMPGQHSTLRHAAALIAGSRHTASEMPDTFRDKLFYLPENAIDPTRFGQPGMPAGDSNGPMRVCFVGRLVPYKGADMLINAAAPLVQSGLLTLDIVGDGPMMPELRKLAEPLGTGITFHGWQPHDQVQGILATCHLFAFPSIREFGGGAVLEAMALGLPPLIVDYAGPAELVLPGLGYKIPLGSRSEITHRLQAQLKDLAGKPQDLRAAGARAKAHVAQHFTWQAKARQIAQIYNWVQTPYAPKPVLVPE